MPSPAPPSTWWYPAPASTRSDREQISLSTDYLHGKTTWSANFVDSKENDYKARTWSLSVSQDMFGDLTTLSIGYSQGKDHIFDATDPDFADKETGRNYRLGITQVLTRDMLLSLNFETVTEEGYLQNPYRFMRYVNTSGSYSLGPEVFPRTRTGNAGSARLKYYLPWRAAVEGGYRFYADTWGIKGHTAGLEYTHPLWNRWVFTGSYRFYTQNSADFFMDLFPRADYQNFMARDKETSALNTQTFGAGASYEFPVTWASWLKRGTVNLHYNYMMVHYKEFRDLRDYPPGTAPRRHGTAVRDEREHRPVLLFLLVLSRVSGAPAAGSPACAHHPRHPRQTH